MGWCPNTPAMRTSSTILPPLPVTLPAVEPGGGDGSAGRIRRGIGLVTVSVKILNRNKQLLWFSLLTGLVLAFMFIAQYGVRLLGTYPYDAIDFPRWLVLTFAIDLVSVFCLTVLLAGLLMSLSSGDPGRSVSFREGLFRTKRYLKPLFTWSVVIAFIGTTIYTLISNFQVIPVTLFPVLDQFPFNFVLLPEFHSRGPIGGTYAMLTGVTFMILATGINIVLFILTLFVVPLLVLENRRLPEAVFGSVSLTKNVWGEIIVCFLLFGLVIAGVFSYLTSFPCCLWICRTSYAALLVSRDCLDRSSSPVHGCALLLCGYHFNDRRYCNFQPLYLWKGRQDFGYCAGKIARRYA